LNDDQRGSGCDGVSGAGEIVEIEQIREVEWIKGRAGMAVPVEPGSEARRGGDPSLSVGTRPEGDEQRDEKQPAHS
jgi:hypothetical protein